MLKINRTETQLIVESEFNADLPPKAKLCGGKWNPQLRSWIFDIQAEKQVSEIYRDCYGQWDDLIEEVNLCCYAEDEKWEYCDSLTLGGRSIARATGRDSGAKTSDGVIVLQGGFTSGGSVKNWNTKVRAGTIFRLLHVPKTKAETLIQFPEWCSKIEIESINEKINSEKLIEEKEKLLKRIQEIDNLLGRI